MNILLVFDKYPYGNMPKTGKYPFIYNKLSEKDLNVSYIAFNCLPDRSSIIKYYKLKYNEDNTFELQLSILGGLQDFVKRVFARLHLLKFYEKLYHLLVVAFIRFIVNTKIKNNNIDIIHVWGEDKQLTGIEIARFIKNKYKSKIVWNFHGSSTYDISCNTSRYEAIKKYLNDVAYLLPVSNSLHIKLKDLYGSKVKIETVYNPVNTDAFTLKKDILPKQVLVDDIKIVHISKLQEIKNVTAIIKSIKYLKNDGYNVKLNLIGKNKLPNKLQKIIITNELENCINNLGQLSSLEINNILLQCDIYVQASFQETFGYPVAEALFCGLPVVTTPCGGPQELVDEISGVICKGFKPIDIYQGIADVIKNLENFDAFQISINAKKKVGHSQVINKLCNIYEGLVLDE